MENNTTERYHLYLIKAVHGVTKTTLSAMIEQMAYGACIPLMFRDHTHPEYMAIGLVSANMFEAFDQSLLTFRDLAEKHIFENVHGNGKTITDYHGYRICIIN